MNGASTGWEAQRWHMVEKQLKRRGIYDQRVLIAMGEIPREQFIPENERQWSYADEPVSIGHGQTISQPYMTALMVQCLDLKGTEKVLEIGTGCGYHAAVLASLAAEVVTVELIPELADLARRNLKTTSRDGNIQVICSDGSIGYQDLMPYDAISVAAAAPDVPPKLSGQLNDPGKIVVPVGALDEQELMVITKAGGSISSEVASRCRFVPLRGGGGWKFS